MQLNIAYMGSGKLGYICLQQVFRDTVPCFIFTDKNSPEIISYSEQKSVPCYIGNPRRDSAEKFIKNFEVDVLLSVNYLFIVEHRILKYVKKYAINLHGSMLPKYRGRTPHVWSIINGETETGITAHLMVEDCDAGAIVHQERVPIKNFYTGNDLLEVFNSKYPVIINKVLSQVKNNSLTLVTQDEGKATYFGKREPKDGEISWDWQKERIYNWVRALSSPYPGAFTYSNGQKVIIDTVGFSDHGYTNTMPNGIILRISPSIVVKTPNGAIELTDIRNIDEIDLKPLERLGEYNEE